MFEQAELPGTRMGPNGPPNATGTAYIAPEIANSRKSGHLGHYGNFVDQNGHHFGHFGQPCRPAISERTGVDMQGGHAEKKVPLRALLA